MTVSAKAVEGLQAATRGLTALLAELTPKKKKRKKGVSGKSEIQSG